MHIDVCLSKFILVTQLTYKYAIIYIWIWSGRKNAILHICMHDVMSEFSDARQVSEGRVNIM